MSYNLFLDDIRQPEDVANYTHSSLREMYRKEEWVIVRNYAEFIDYITINGLPEKVSFDHDLADEHYEPYSWTGSWKYIENTGYDCAQWFVDYCLRNNHELPFIYVHSKNPVGKENIESIFASFKKFQNEKRKEL